MIDQKNKKASRAEITPIFLDVLIPDSSLNPTPRIALFVVHGGRHSDRHGGGQGGQGGLAGP